MYGFLDDTALAPEYVRFILRCNFVIYLGKLRRPENFRQDRGTIGRDLNPELTDCEVGVLI
jgi:hypothetical protein